MASIIRSLPECVRSSVRSGIFLFDSTRVVEELVFNSLDARATQVSVFVSVGSCYVKVVDDGGGITRDGLELAGERYATSKFLNLDDLNSTTANFGFRGEALASISEVSVLEIVARTCGRPNGYKKVLKGCKCLYLGIDDDRKEVGTTVVVRDLFYNQPVRRNYMQSSPNKVLQSIKKCVMRLALVRPNISFKVVDIERENELFCTHSASSPLSLLTNGFGMEVSTSLHDIEVEHESMKLSGYISGPCNNLNMKALEYVYINSQFVCKGPIHKLLSQLAIRFEDPNSQGTDDEFQNKKRSRSQPCPAYILNLSCPRSLYDLTYEPSKTYVQFKDWAPILDFIEKAIKRFWEESVACGESSNRAPYRLQEEQPWKAEVNVISAADKVSDFDILKFGNQNSKDCLHLFLSTSDKLTEDDYHQTNREDVSTSLGYLHRGTEMFREQQSKRDFLCRADYSSNLLDGSYAKCLSTVNRKHNSLLMYDNTGLARDYFVDSKFPAAEESFYDSVPFDAPSSSHGKKLYNNLLDDSYAKCMSSVKRKHNSLLMYDKTALSQGDNFLDGKFPAAESFYDNVPFDAPSSSHGKKFLKADADVINESLKGDLLYDCHGSSYVDINRDFQKPFLTRCSTQGSILHEKALFVNDEHEFQIDSFWSKQNVREDCGSGKNLCAHPYPEVVKKLKVSRYSDFLSGEFSEESCLPPDSCYTKTQIGSSGSDDQLLKSEWHPVYQEPSSQVNAWDVDHITDINDLGGVFRYYERVHRTKLLDDEENECDSSYNMSRKAKQDHCTSSFANTEFDFDGAVDFNKMFNRLVEWPGCSDICSTKRSDILNEEPDWLLPESRVENCQSRNKSKGKRDHFRHPAMENNLERYRRSSSAPPFHRSKRRFFSLNQPSEMIAKRPGQMSNPAFNHREAGDFKHPRQSPGALQTSTEDLILQNFKTDEKQRSDVMGDTQVNDNAEIDLFEGFENLNNTTSRDLMLKEVQDSIDNRTKWRKCSPQTPKNDKLVDVQSQNNILDITSGFLHLAGDSLIPETISKKCLEDAKVLYQVDKKFIPVVAGSTLAVIDQHAADERIRLEELRQKVLSGEAKAITYLDAEQELVLPEIGYQLLHSYCEQIKDWGWICNIHTQNSESFKRNLDILHRLPMVVTLVAVPCILGVNLNDVDLLEFLQQLAETEGSSTMPPSVIRVLNSKACRGAIMFGDSLLPSECSLIVEELKDTSLCFQCAHGRPTTVPLVNLEALHNQIAKLGLMNDCSNDTWHGLHRHKVCVERAADRLSSARGS